MAYSITNNSKAPRGIYNTARRLVFVQPGETRTIDVANIDGVRRLPFLDVEPVGDLPDPPAELGRLVKAPADDLKALRAEYQAKMGKRPFPGWDAAELRRRMAE